MNEKELNKHRQALLEYDEKFDEEKNLVKGTVGEHAYHTKLAGRKVHDLRASLSYAAALLYGEIKEDIPKAEKIIKRILELQDTDPKSNTFGLWSYFEEEPLEEMDAPDRNWADFLGKLLIEILYVHKDKLDRDLIKLIESGTRYACEAIMRRNEGVQYTNVAFTDTLVTIAAGEFLKVEKYINYGKDKLERFIAFERNNGGVFEYNSPCYTPLVTRDAATFLKLVKDENARKNAELVNDIAWKMIAEHFRADMCQLAGPQSRAYNDYLTEEFLYNIELACDGKVTFDCEKKFGIETFWQKPFCPLKYRGYFKGIQKPESSEKLIMKGFNYPYFAFSQIAATYHSDNYVLGTYNREELWNQRRPLLGYIRGEGKPSCFRVRCLHEGYDFSSAVLHTVQEKSSVLGCVNFSNNRGDTHIGLDSASDAEYESLKVDFELIGDSDKISFSSDGASAKMSADGVDINIKVIAAKFGDFKINYNIEKFEDKIVFSAVLYSGKKRKINLKELEAAYVCFILDFGELSSCCKFKESDNYIEAECTSLGKQLKIEACKRVLKFMDNMYDDRQWKDGKRYEDIAK